MNKKPSGKFRLWIFSLLIALPVLLNACSGAPKVEWNLSITGAVENPTIFSYADLADLPMIDLDDILMEKSRGEDEFQSFSGVELSLLLESVGAIKDFSSITAKAADGYAIEIPVDEMVDGIVALKDGNEWIVKSDPNAGPIRLVFPETPANRWVFQVTEIVVNP
jgi:DMSO/TMAO reductase YedYZ molybdopterin-dependent catalytic subunit